MFSGILVDNHESGFRAELREIDEDQLPELGVNVRVDYSTVNRKDARTIIGRPPIISEFPLVPGIDLAGTVESSAHPDYQTGDAILLNGCGGGVSHWGGLAQKASLRREWLVPLPANFSQRQAMAIGTTGYTAMLCVMALEKHGVKPDSGDILVTDACGNIGSVAVAILSKLGFRVVAMTRHWAESERVSALDAAEVIRSCEYEKPGHLLQEDRWAGVVDVVGGTTLANACASTRYGGVVTACGSSGGVDFNSTVAPFILRGVTLVGIEPMMCPRTTRLESWRRLSEDLDVSKLDASVHELPLAGSIAGARQLLAGQLGGRLVVNVND